MVPKSLFSLGGKVRVGMSWGQRGRMSMDITMSARKEDMNTQLRAWLMLVLSKSWRKLKDKDTHPSPPTLVQTWQLIRERITQSTPLYYLFRSWVTRRTETWGQRSWRAHPCRTIILHIYLLLYRTKYSLILQLKDRSSRPALPLPSVEPWAGVSLGLSFLPCEMEIKVIYLSKAF